MAELLFKDRHTSRGGSKMTGVECRNTFHRDLNMNVLGKEVLAGRGMLRCIQEAQALGMDPNDYVQQVLGWKSPLPILEKIAFPQLSENSIVCEIGPGTGAYSRHLARKISDGQLHLVDSSPQIAQFLVGYFEQSANVSVHHNDGYKLPFEKTDWIDMVLSFGTFVALELSNFYQYSREIFRHLKPGGVCIIEYIDPLTEGGRDFLARVAPDPEYYYYTFHASVAVDEVFVSGGFIPEPRWHIDHSCYAVFRKPSE